MKAKVYFGKELIAETKLHHNDNPYNDVYGNLAVNDSFHKFITFDEKENVPVSVSPDAINVQLENGCFVYSQEKFLFTKDGIPYFADIDIQNIDDMVMDFITKKNPDSFMEEPWQPVSIIQKNSF